jgi:hypothetical protein
VGGHAVELAGSQASYVDVGDVAIPDDFTFEFWLNISPTQPSDVDHIILTKDTDVLENQLRFGLRDGYLYFAMTNPSGQDGGFWTGTGYALRSTSAPTYDAWTHLAVTKSGQTFVLYVDGAVQMSMTATVAMSHSSSTPLRFGGRNLTTPSWFHGVIDEVRIWNTPRSAAEIASDRVRTIRTTHPAYASLVAYWRLDEGSGATTSDSRGTWDGVLSLATWVTPGAPVQ